MAYTPEQQQRIDLANAKVASAQKIRDREVASYQAKYNNFCNDGWWQYLTDCDIRNVQSKWIKITSGVLSVYTYGLSLVAKNLIAKRWSKPTSCEDALEKGLIISWDCQRGHGDCIKSSTCDSKVREYNSKLTAIQQSAIASANAQEDLSNAQEDLKNLLNSIAQEVQNDPDFINEQNSILAGIQKNKQKLIFFVVIIVIALVAIISYKRP